jgi:hypothetical protein
MGRACSTDGEEERGLETRQESRKHYEDKDMREEIKMGLTEVEWFGINWLRLVTNDRLVCVQP